MARKRLTIYLPVDLLERSRNAVYWTEGLTLAGLIEAALRDSLERREASNAGPFPRRLAELKGGRPKRTRETGADLNTLARPPLNAVEGRERADVNR
ncbi:hypothetical protein [Candidatus Nitrospira bockiana]